jgi:site-specific recombinase
LVDGAVQHVDELRLVTGVARLVDAEREQAVAYDKSELINMLDRANDQLRSLVSELETEK